MTRQLLKGEPIKFRIRVYNQGIVKADELELVDYIPDGLELEDADWEIRHVEAGITRAYYNMTPKMVDCHKMDCCLVIV